MDSLSIITFEYLNTETGFSKNLFKSSLSFTEKLPKKPFIIAKQELKNRKKIWEIFI